MIFFFSHMIKKKLFWFILAFFTFSEMENKGPWKEKEKKTDYPGKNVIQERKQIRLRKWINRKKKKIFFPSGFFL